MPAYERGSREGALCAEGMATRVWSSKCFESTRRARESRPLPAERAQRPWEDFRLPQEEPARRWPAERASEFWRGRGSNEPQARLASATRAICAPSTRWGPRRTRVSRRSVSTMRRARRRVASANGWLGGCSASRTRPTTGCERALALLASLGSSRYDRQLQLFWPGNDPARPAASRHQLKCREAVPVRFPKPSSACPVSLSGRSDISMIDLAERSWQSRASAREAERAAEIVIPWRRQ